MDSMRYEFQNSLIYTDHPVDHFRRPPQGRSCILKWRGFHIRRASVRIDVCRRLHLSSRVTIANVSWIHQH